MLWCCDCLLFYRWFNFDFLTSFNDFQTRDCSSFDWEVYHHKHRWQIWRFYCCYYPFEEIVLPTLRGVSVDSDPDLITTRCAVWSWVFTCITWSVVFPWMIYRAQWTKATEGRAEAGGINVQKLSNSLTIRRPANLLLAWIETTLCRYLNRTIRQLC